VDVQENIKEKFVLQVLIAEVSLLLTLNIVGAGGLEPPKINYPI
jgi:hypothetical protein